jgi:putative methyltransferase|tara:strand:+ start:836 stop:2707 length:1872 start_codon:yes stop_codon:yes gene_type:complete
MKNIYMVQVSFEMPGDNIIRYFPYSVGVVWSYASTFKSIEENYDLKEIIFLKESLEDIIARLDNPSVFAVSAYIWNENYNIHLAKAVKDKWPDCKIIVGGPSVPNNNPDFFTKNPWIDYLIHHEGEISFSGLLRSFVNDIDIMTVPGISINVGGKMHTTGPSKRIDDLSGIPSPYTSGLFDDVLQKATEQGIKLNGIIETNRGCPFQCTFCDWGGTTFSKIKKFNLQRITDEIEWFGRNEVELITNADANFGIFKDRDTDITDVLIDTKAKYGYPMIFDTNWSKNTNDTCVSLAQRMLDAKMMRRFTAAVQSMNPDTLKAIKRVNLDGAQLDNVAYTAKERGVSVSTELIIGLPEETYDTWREGVIKLMKDNFIIEAHPLSMLPNSHMSHPSYKKQYGLKTKTIKSYYSHVIDETQEVVIATKDIDESTMKKIYVWTWFVGLLEQNGFTNFISRYLDKKHQISLEEFYEHLIDHSTANEESILHPHVRKWQAYADEHQYARFHAGAPYQKVVEDIGMTNRNNFFDELYEMTKELIGAEDLNLKSVFNIQKLQQSVPDLKDKQILECNANLYEFVEKDRSLNNGPTTYVFHHNGIEERHKDWFSFMNFTRKNRGWKVKIEQISQ